MKHEIADALLKDLGKCYNASVAEIYICRASAEHDLKHLKTYM